GPPAVTVLPTRHSARAASSPPDGPRLARDFSPTPEPAPAAGPSPTRDSTSAAGPPPTQESPPGAGPAPAPGRPPSPRRPPRRPRPPTGGHRPPTGSRWAELDRSPTRSTHVTSQPWVPTCPAPAAGRVRPGTATGGRAAAWGGRR